MIFTSKAIIEYDVSWALYAYQMVKIFSKILNDDVEPFEGWRGVRQMKNYSFELTRGFAMRSWGEVRDELRTW